MQNDRDFRSGVFHRLFDGVIETKPFGSFTFDMQVGNIDDDVRRIGTALKLDAAPGRDAQHAG